MQEHLPGKAFNEMTLVYAGDARNNMGNSMPRSCGAYRSGFASGRATGMLAGSCAGYGMPRPTAQQNGGNITLTEDVAKGVEGADFIYTDVWVSMGKQKEKWAERIALLRDYQVNSKMMQLTGNPEVKFLHCLPAFHDDQTTLGKENGGRVWPTWRNGSD